MFYVPCSSVDHQPPSKLSWCEPERETRFTVQLELCVHPKTLTRVLVLADNKDTLYIPDSNVKHVLVLCSDESYGSPRPKSGHQKHISV